MGQRSEWLMLLFSLLLLLQEELKLRQREQALLAERQLLQDQQAANTARDAELELLHLKYHATTQQMAK
jgi:hypothetical protein